MRIYILIIILAIFSCTHNTQYLNYPQNIEDIKEVTLIRPDKQSKGKFATIKKLTSNQIKELLDALKSAKSVGPIKSNVDFYIHFVTNTNQNIKLKIKNNKVKDFDSDFAFEFEQLDF